MAESSEAAQPPSKPGDCALVLGLESEGGRLLNGRKGIVTNWLEDAGRFEVRLGPEKVVRLKPANLQRVELEVGERLRLLGLAPEEPAPVAPVEQPTFEPGQAVEVFGLESESGRQLNGQQGTIAKFDTQKCRFEVRLPSDRSVSLKADNLRKLPSVPRGEEPGHPRERSRSRSPRPSSNVAAGGGPEAGSSRTEVGKSGDAGSPGAQTGGYAAEEDASGEAGASAAPPVAAPAAAPPPAAAAPAAAAPAAAEPPGAEAPAPAAAGAAPEAGLRAGQCVEVFGLQSESGRALNGQTGIVTRYIEETDRFEVRFIPEKLVSLKMEHLRKVDFSLAGSSEAAGAEPVAQAEAEGRPRSRSRSRSKSSSSSSSSSGSKRTASRPQPSPPAAPAPEARPAQEATPTPTPAAPAFSVGDRVEVFGLESEGGRRLNGQQGSVVRHLPERGRFEVSLGQGGSASLRPESLRKLPPGASSAGPPRPAPQPETSPRQAEPRRPSADPAATSLSSLLGMGRTEPKPDEPKPEVWQSVWSRSGSKAPSGKLSDEQMEFFKSMQEEEERRDGEMQRLRAKVEAELARAGPYSEEMLEAAFKEQREKFKLQRLLRPQDKPDF